MLSFLKQRLPSLLACVYSLTVALFWLALRVNWSGISKALGADKAQTFWIMQLPLLVCILLFLTAAFSLFALWRLSGKRWPTVVSVGIAALFTVVSVVVILLGAKDYLPFILPRFALSLGVAAAIGCIALLLFALPQGQGSVGTGIKCGLVALLTAVSVVVGYGITVGSRFTYLPVVYAVEDEYQIVFSTNSSAVAWVEIDGERYYDLYAGSMKSEDRVHKVCVPQSVLDAAGGYSIHAEKMIYRGPFGGYKGKPIHKSFAFYPVDSSDGLVYYSMADVHHARAGAVAAASSVEGLDFLVMLGDIVGMADREVDAQLANRIAYEVTGGEIPVVYARGNHEIKGRYAEQLYKYVGSNNGNFYYWFTLSDVFGITLDLGEDHDDDWWEYYGTAQFALYQAEQTRLLEQLLTDRPFDAYAYTLVACHIPIPFVNSRHNHTEIKATWTDLLNDIAPDLVVSGHQHDLYPFLDGQATKYNDRGKLVYNDQFKKGKTYGGYLTDYHFNSFIVGRRGEGQTDSVGSLNRSKHIGLVTRVDIASGVQICRYVNSLGQTVAVFNPFVDGKAQTSFVLSLS